MAEAAVMAGMPDSAVLHAATTDEAAEAIARVMRPGDVVLVKGSRGIHTEVVADRLKAGLAAPGPPASVGETGDA
jgi:UDP-N-acetylmuramoyl-tripeptide--D-alanyl-D-alanine ligase